MPPRVQKMPLEPRVQSPAQAELRKLIEEAAYYRAEKRGFAPGYEAEDWREAETEVLARMSAAEGRR